MKTENEIQQEAEKRFPEPNMEDFAYLALLSNGIDEARKLGQRVGATRQAFVDGYNCAATEIQSRVSELERENKSLTEEKDKAYGLMRDYMRLADSKSETISWLKSEKERLEMEKEGSLFEKRRLEKEVETLRGKIEHVTQDINWMTNNQKLLTRSAFNYLDLTPEHLDKNSTGE